MNERSAKSIAPDGTEETIHYQELASDIMADYNFRLADQLDDFAEFFWTDENGYAGCDERPMTDEEKKSVSGLYERCNTFTEKTVKNALAEYTRLYGQTSLLDVSISTLRSYLAGTMSYYLSDII